MSSLTPQQRPDQARKSQHVCSTVIPCSSSFHHFFYRLNVASPCLAQCCCAHANRKPTHRTDIHEGHKQPLAQQEGIPLLCSCDPFRASSSSSFPTPSPGWCVTVPVPLLVDLLHISAITNYVNNPYCLQGPICIHSIKRFRV